MTTLGNGQQVLLTIKLLKMSKQLLIKNGNNTSIGVINSVSEKLPVGNYIIKYDDNKDFYYLQDTESFNIPDKIYGDTSIVDRWIKSFHKSTKNMGIMLCGNKGNGKTLTARLFCEKLNRPVLFLTSPYKGPEFESFISSPLFNECVIFIDEYEKLYNYDNENIDALLSLMDGMFNTKLCFLLTINDFSEVSDKLKNRLGRIKYFKNYPSVDHNVLVDLVNDLLVDKSLVEQTIESCKTISFLNIDMIVSIIKEMNMFNESFEESCKHLNIVNEDLYYDTEINIGNDNFECNSYRINLYSKNSSIRITYVNTNKKIIDYINEGKLPENHDSVYMKDCLEKVYESDCVILKFKNYNIILKPVNKDISLF